MLGCSRSPTHPPTRSHEVLLQCICPALSACVPCVVAWRCKQVKKGPLSETSPMLNDISGVPTWNKVGELLW